MMRADLKHLSAYRVQRGSYGSTDELGNFGAFRIPLRERTIACCIVADGELSEWEHVSVHVECLNQKRRWIQRTPTWAEMAYIKSLFWGEEETVLEFHPPRSVYVNQHPHCLHLWRPEKVEIPLPPLACV